MAQLQKYGAGEALNVDAAPKWAVQTAVTTSSTASNHVTIDPNLYHKIAVTASHPIHVVFDTTSDTTVSATNDLVLYGSKTHYLNVPVIGDSGATVYFHFRRQGSQDAAVQMVLM